MEKNGGNLTRKKKEQIQCEAKLQESKRSQIQKEQKKKKRELTLNDCKA